MNNQETNKEPDFKIDWCHEKINPVWDAFVEEVNGDIAQTSAWTHYEYQHFGWRTVRFIVKNDEQMVAGCQITIIHDDLLGNIGLVRSGPSFKVKPPELLSLAAKELKNSIQTLNLTYLMVSPDYYEHDLVPFLEDEQFGTKFPNLPPYKDLSFKGATLVLDLTLSTDDLLTQMKSSRRQGIRKGMKSPFRVRPGGREDLKVFCDLYHSSVRRRKYTDPVTNKTVDYYPSKDCDELYRMWDELAPKGWIQLFMGTVDDEVICGAMVFPFGKTLRGSTWGWNMKYPEYFVSETTQWEMIQWSKSKGMLYYDFVQIDPQVAEAYRSSGPMPEELKTNFFYGPTLFKLQFGGNILKAPGLFVGYSDEMKHLMETAGDELARLLKQSKDFYWAKKNFFRDRQVSFYI